MHAQHSVVLWLPFYTMHRYWLGDDHWDMKILPIRTPVELSRKWVELPRSQLNEGLDSLVPRRKVLQD